MIPKRCTAPEIKTVESRSMNTVVIFGNVVVLPNNGLHRVDVDLPDPILDALSQLYWSERDPQAREN